MNKLCLDFSCLNSIMSDCEDEEGYKSPQPPPFKRAPSFEVVIDPIDEPWEWPAKPENTEATSDDSDDDIFGRGSAASNEEVGCFRFWIEKQWTSFTFIFGHDMLSSKYVVDLGGYTWEDTWFSLLNFRLFDAMYEYYWMWQSAWYQMDMFCYLVVKCRFKITYKLSVVRFCVIWNCSTCMRLVLYKCSCEILVLLCVLVKDALRI